VTAWQWIVGLLLGLGGIVLAVAKADLEDPTCTGGWPAS
jgi:hypothetical protein